MMVVEVVVGIQTLAVALPMNLPQKRVVEVGAATTSVSLELSGLEM
jgi:hypothetical protein